MCVYHNRKLFYVCPVTADSDRELVYIQANNWSSEVF